MVATGADVEEIASVSAGAAEDALLAARGDPALSHVVWLLTQLPLAARATDFEAAAGSVGIKAGGNASLMEVVAAFGEAVDRAAADLPGRTDLGEMARNAAAESLTSLVGNRLPGLFGSTAADVRLELGKFASGDGFAVLARDFFARLTKKHLDYFLSRTVPPHVGLGHRLATTRDHADFNVALELYCRETSRIIQDFAGGWFGKTHFGGGITPEKAGRFAAIALKKLSSEMIRRRGDA